MNYICNFSFTDDNFQRHKRGEKISDRAYNRLNTSEQGYFEPDDEEDGLIDNIIDIGVSSIFDSNDTPSESSPSTDTDTDFGGGDFSGGGAGSDF